MADQQGGLQFGQSYSPKDFLTKIGASKLEIIKNPKTDKFFFRTDGPNPVSGAMSGSQTVEEIVADPVITECSGDNGDFHIMHKRRTENVQATIEL